MKLSDYISLIFREQKPDNKATGEVYGAPGRGRSTAISFVTVFIFLFLWWAVTRWEFVNPLFLPSPAAVWEQVIEVGTIGFGGSSLWFHAWKSIYRVFLAFFFSCLTAIPIGMAMGMSRVFRGVFDPPIEFYRPIPPLAYLPLIIIWFGIGETSKILLIYLACFAPMALSTRAGVRSVSTEQIHVAYSLGATRSQVIRHIVLKAALPEILTGMRIGIGFGWTTLVAAEMVAAAAGLGYMILNASEFLVTDVVVMGIVVIGFIALLSDLLMRYLELKLVPWKGKV
jgi:taurine transport system permease protein